MNRRQFLQSGTWAGLGLSTNAAGLPSPISGNLLFLAPDTPNVSALWDTFKKRVTLDIVGFQGSHRLVTFKSETAAVEIVRNAVAANAPVAAIVAASGLAASAAKRATQSIPIVFASQADPVAFGLITSLQRPGGNLSGFTYDVPLEPRQARLLSEFAPRAKSVAILDDGAWVVSRNWGSIRGEFETTLGAAVDVLSGADRQRMLALLSTSRRDRYDAWFVPITNTAAECRKELTAFFLEGRRPVLWGRSFFVREGGLVSLNELVPDPIGMLVNVLRLCLSGIPIGEIPVRRPIDVDLAVNLRTAETQGIRVPESVLLRATQVIR